MIQIGQKRGVWWRWTETGTRNLEAKRRQSQATVEKWWYSSRTSSVFFPVPVPHFWKKIFTRYVYVPRLKKKPFHVPFPSTDFENNPYPLLTRTRILKIYPFTLCFRSRTWVRVRDGYGFRTRTPGYGVGRIFGHFWDFFKYVRELFRKFLGIVFGLKRSTFGCIVNWKCRRMTLKIEIFSQNFNHFGRLRGWFWTIFGVKKISFGNFSKLFWSCSWSF